MIQKKKAMAENLECEAEMDLVHFEEQHGQVPLSGEEMDLVHFEEQHGQVPLSGEEIDLNELWWPPLN